MKKLLTNNLVQLILRVLSSLVGLILLLMGLGFLILPEVFAINLFIEPTRAVGINSLRGDLGALFLGMSFFCLLAILSSYRRLLLIPIVFLALVVTGRLVSYVIDDNPIVLVSSLISELVFLSILTLSLVSFSFNSDSKNNLPTLKTLFNKKFIISTIVIILLVIVALTGQRQLGTFLWNRLAGKQMQQNRISNLPDGLHVGLAGTGSPMPDAKRKGVCTFVLAGKKLFIVDSGPGSTLNLELMQVPLSKIEAVLITHLHSDHIGGLGELMLKAWSTGARTKPLKIFGPKGVDIMVKGFNQAYSVDAEFRFAHHGDAVTPMEGHGGLPQTIEGFDENRAAVVYQSDDVKVIAFLVDHQPVKPALGFRFDYKGRSVVISGDTLPNESLRYHSKNVDLLFHEALQPKMLRILNRAAINNGRKVIAHVTSDILTYHTFPEEAARIARDADVHHLVFHHLIPPIPVAILNSAFIGDSKKYYDGPITVGVEGMLFSLLPNTKKILKEWFL